MHRFLSLFVLRCQPLHVVTLHGILRWNRIRCGLRLCTLVELPAPFHSVLHPDVQEARQGERSEG